MPCVHVRLASSRSCICTRRTSRAHPAQRGRILHQPQLYFLEATRTGGGLCGWCSTRKTLSSRGGRGGDFNSASLRPPCVVPILPLQGNYMSACSRCSARYCTVGLANTVRSSRNELARCRSRNPPTKLSYAYLVKPWSLLPGPRQGRSYKIDIEQSTQSPKSICKY